MDWVAPLLTLTTMEIVLGIDNVIFIAILVQRLPASQQANARRLGLGLALVMRLGLLFAISWIMRLVDPVFLLTDLGLPESWFTHSNSARARTPRSHERGFLARSDSTWRRAVLDRQEHA